jgi:trigger factor
MFLMKTEFTEVSETLKHLSFEVPPEVVTAEIERVARNYTRSAKVPGFRPGKVPAKIVKQRYKDQILHDVAHDLIPRLVGTALKERGVDPIVAPDIKDVVIEEGQPLTFGADVQTLPPIDPGTYTGLSLRKPPAVLEVGAVDRALEQLRERHARWQPIEDRPAEAGDTLLLDLTRTRRARLIALPGEAAPAEGAATDGEPERMENVTVEIGASANPPGFDEHLTGTQANDERAFTVTFPEAYEVDELRGATVDYLVTVKGIRRKELLALDDDFAKEVSEAETMDGLRELVRSDLQKGAEADADHQVRHELLQQLSSRLTVAPDVLVDQEVDRRLEEFVRRLMEQGLDPMQVNVDWQDFRERQRASALDTVKSTLVLDEIGKREAIAASEADLDAEIEKFAERAGRTPAAVRARLEKEGAIGRLLAGIRREKTMTWLLEHAQVSS